MFGCYTLSLVVNTSTEATAQSKDSYLFSPSVGKLLPAWCNWPVDAFSPTCDVLCCLQLFYIVTISK